MKIQICNVVFHSYRNFWIDKGSLNSLQAKKNAWVMNKWKSTLETGDWAHHIWILLANLIINKLGELVTYK